MTSTLTFSQQQLHDRAVQIGNRHRQWERQAIAVLQEVDHTKLYRKLDCSSLFLYAVRFLKLDESVVYSLITVARKARDIPRLHQSLKNQKLSVAKANRIVATLTSNNAEHLVSYAERHTAVEINNEVARLRGAAGLPPKMQNLKVSPETQTKLKRAKALMNSNIDADTALGRILDEHLDRHDPVRKAKRAKERKDGRVSTILQQTAKDQIRPAPLSTSHKLPKTQILDKAVSQPQLCTYRVSRRQPLTAEEKHAVFHRDGGQCTHRDANGERCTNDRFLHIHHIRPVSQGGTNDPENLTTLCSFHHDLVHQLSLPIEGQVTWLRDNRATYGGQFCDN